MCLSHGDEILLPINITIRHLDLKAYQSPKRLKMLSLDSISIFHERSENVNSNNKNLKANIYHMTLKTML